MLAFHFSLDGKYFENETFQKTINHVISLIFLELGSVGLCQHSFEHNTISGASGIMLA